MSSTHSQHQHNNGSAFGPGSMASRPQGPYSPPPRQGSHGPMFMPPPQRGGRGRNVGANFHRMSLPNGASRPLPVQTQLGPYDYSMAPLSAMAFQPQPYWDSVVMQLLKNQIEYYFSIENLCKDMYLRKRMDGQGFVNLHFVAAFKRIRELTSDMGMIRAVCEASMELDFVVGEDDLERLRRRSGWQNFVLPMEERDDFARHNGPTHITFKNRPYAFPMFNGMAPAPYGMSPPLAYNPQGDAQLQLQQLPERHGMNGVVNGTYAGPTQLSAEVPDFSPSGSAMVGAAVPSKEAGVMTADGGAKARGAGPDDEPSPTTMPNGIHMDGVAEATQS